MTVSMRFLFSLTYLYLGKIGDDVLTDLTVGYLEVVSLDVHQLNLALLI